MPRRRTLNLSSDTKTIPANGSIELNVSGVRFLCKESDGTFKLRVDDSPAIPWEAGLYLDLTEDPEYRPGDVYKKLTFINDTGTDIDVTFYTIGPGIRDSRFNNLIDRNTAITTVAVPTRLVVTEDSLGAGKTLIVGGSVSIAGTNGGKIRKQIVVTNTSFDDDLYLLDDTGKWLGTVFIRQAFTLETNATVQVLNPATSSASVVANIAETYPT